MKNPLNQFTKYLARRGERRSPHWDDVRTAHLAREGWCRWCGSTVNLEVHHVTPFHLRPDLELDPANLITLCEQFGTACHLRIGHLGCWTDHNPHVRRMATAPAPQPLRGIHAIGKLK